MAQWIPLRPARVALLRVVAPLTLVLGLAHLACGPTTPTATSRPSLSASTAPTPAAEASAPLDTGSAEVTEPPSPFHHVFRDEVSIARVGATVAVFSPKIVGIFRGTSLFVDRPMNAALTGCGSGEPGVSTIEEMLGDDAEKPLVVTAISDGLGGTTRTLSSWDGKQWKSLLVGNDHTRYVARGGFILSAARYFSSWSYALRSMGGARFTPTSHPRCKGNDHLQAEDLFGDERGGVLVAGGDPCESSKGFGIERFASKGGRGTIQWFGDMPQPESPYAMSDPHTLWGIAEEKDLVRLDLEHGSSKRMAGPAADRIWGLAIVDSVMWLGAGEKVFRGRDGTDWEELPLPRGVHPTRLVAVSDGGVWVAAPDGVWTTVSGVPETTFPTTCP